MVHNLGDNFFPVWEAAFKDRWIEPVKIELNSQNGGVKLVVVYNPLRDPYEKAKARGDFGTDCCEFEDPDKMPRIVKSHNHRLDVAVSLFSSSLKYHIFLVSREHNPELKPEFFHQAVHFTQAADYTLSLNRKGSGSGRKGHFHFQAQRTAHYPFFNGSYPKLEDEILQTEYMTLKKLRSSHFCLKFEPHVRESDHYIG